MTDDRYKDIIGLEHHTSAVHPRMPREARAAQFSPFAALTGFGEVIEETGRLTEVRTELAEDERKVLDAKFRASWRTASPYPWPTSSASGSKSRNSP